MATKATAKKVVPIKATAGSKTVTLPFVKTTPGTHVYGTEEREGIVCRQIYVLKSEMPDEPPASIEVTVSWNAPK